MSVMTTGKFAVRGAVLGAAVIMSSAAWAAQNAKPVPVPIPKPVAVPVTEKILSAPAQPADAGRSIAAQTQPTQRAGLTKPVKVYWFLSGR
jgi:hypothetical protein